MVNFNITVNGGERIEIRLRSEWQEEGVKEGISSVKAEGRAEGPSNDRLDGWNEGVAWKNAEWAAWNERRIEAERDGASFDEPPPDYCPTI